MKWDPFVKVIKILPSIKDLKRRWHMKKPEALSLLKWMGEGETFKNNIYQVEVRESVATQEGWPKMVWLSIKRIDRDPVHDWRDLQRIKSELCGAECEAVELYPAESRMVDTSNQYHLWVIVVPGVRFPFGFEDGRTVGSPEAAASVGAKQRKFEEV